MPGCALAYETSSRNDFAGTEGLTTNTTGTVPSKVIGEKSFAGSKFCRYMTGFTDITLLAAMSSVYPSA